MLKRDMIDRILETENRLYNHMLEMEGLMGNDSRTYKRARGKWSAVWSLAEALGLSTACIKHHRTHGGQS